MITVSDELNAAISGGSFSSSYVFDLIVDGQVKLSNQPLTQCELSADAGQKILTTGSATFTYTDDEGESIAPTDLTSWFTPVATFLDISYRVTVGDEFVGQVLRGRFKLTGVSDVVGKMVKFQDRVLSVGDQLNLEFSDRFYTTNYEDFLVPSGPSQTGSVWAEIGALTGFPLDRTGVADAAITRTVTYKDNRLDAVFDLASILNANPYMTPAGAVGMRPLTWGDPVKTLTQGAGGTITQVSPNDLSDDGIYNQVVVRSWDDSQSAVLATAEVELGPLRYGGPFGRKPYFASSQFVTTAEQAQAYARSLLPSVSQMPAITYSIQCVPDPTLEVWDVVNFEANNGLILPGRITKITLPDRGPMTITGQVNRD